MPGAIQNDSERIRSERGLGGWLREHDPLLAVVVWGAIAAGLVLLADGLPPRTFFAGDPGIKLIAARNAISHPTHPFDIDLPHIGAQRLMFLDPFFRVHGDHAYATISELFPLMSAPLIALFGMRGAFVLPALGFLLALGATARVGIMLDNRRSRTMLIFITAACTPLLFYALEFWEHALAVGVAATATVLFVKRQSMLSLFTCGLLLGVTVLLRPEAVWYGAALLVGARWLPSRFSIGNVMVVVAGAAIVFLPFATVSSVHSGQWLGGHVTSNMSGIAQGWWSSRIAICRIWFVPHNIAWVVGWALLSFAAITMNSNPSARNLVRVVGAAFVAIVALTAARRVFELPSLWSVAPAALIYSWGTFGRASHGRPFLVAVALVSSLLVVLTAPNDGGAQWGPRYLLFAFIPVAILTTDALAATVVSARFVGVLTVAVVVVSSLLVERNAYKELQAAKRTYERIVEFVERETPPGGYIVTDLWWLDQVTAALYPTRVVLFVENAASAQRAFALLANAASVSVVRSEVDSPHDSFGQWRERSAFVVKRRTQIPERTLTLFQLNSPVMAQ